MEPLNLRASNEANLRQYCEKSQVKLGAMTVNYEVDEEVPPLNERVRLCAHTRFKNGIPLIFGYRMIFGDWLTK